MKKTTLLLIFIASISNAWAQNIISGNVVDQESELLIGVNISVQNISNLGTATDFDGYYELNVPDGCHKLLFQYIGFEDFTGEICLKNGESRTFNASLVESSEILEMVVISAGKFEQRIEEVTVSMDIIKPALIENRTASSLDQTLNQAPSVNVVDGQANIRSGSGWSYGAGSRVLVMVDGMPLMSGDQGAAQWQLIPMENISQIEIIKGASSVLFGSSALNGTINIRTAYPTDEPLTKLNVVHGFYGKPARESLHWYKGGYTSFNNISFMHSEKKGNQDFVIGANIFYDGGYEYKVTSQRARINFNKTYYSEKVEGLTYGINGNFMRSEIGDAIMYQSDSLGYNALDNDPGYRDGLIINLDPFVSYNIASRGEKHSLRTRFLRNDMNPTSQGLAEYSNVFYMDYQYQKTLKDNIILTSGYTHKNIYAHDKEVYGVHSSLNHSLYSQIDIKHGRLNLSLGGRYEYFSQYNMTISKPFFRSGLNCKLAEATFLRASYGEGIRFPSIIEMFITYNTGPVFIYPNQDLKPESGWSSEIGIKQGLKIGDWRGFIDLALFHMEYDDMMEFSFGRWSNSLEPDELFGIGFKSVNIGKTIIRGAELSIMGEGKIGNTTVTVLGSYTYADPIIADNDAVYYTDIGGNELSYYSTSSNKSGLLKYRYKELAKMDVSVEKNRISTGFSLRYNSYMENIDAIFEDRLFNLESETSMLEEAGLPASLVESSAINMAIIDSRKRNPNGDFIIDLRLGYNLTEGSRIAFNVDNILNKEYHLRPASIGRPRTYSLLYNIKF